jgi:TRAP-type C4-dicarboxylate transport system permease small subunit
VERFFARLERVLEPVLAGLLAFITLGVFIQVVLRYVFAMSFLWCVYLGTAVCSWRHTHFSFDIFAEILSGRAAGVQRLAIDLCVLSVTLVMVVTGWQFSQMSIARLSPALGITLLVPTIIIPVSGVLMSLVSLMDIARDCRQIWTGETPARRQATIEPV